MAQRVLNRLVALIHSELSAIGAHECSLPLIQSYDPWTKSGRLSKMNNMLKLEQERLLLAPTHEEEMTRLIATTIQSYKQLPLILFQTGSKFRREARCRGGLLRTREFVMNDAYSFSTIDTITDVYTLMSNVYESIFKRLDLNPIVKQADAGDIGGSLSHEYHLTASIGDDKVQLPDGTLSNSIEVAHTFILDDIYTKTFSATYRDSFNQEQYLQMGCYGIGVSRLIAAIQEHQHKIDGLVWPQSITPFDVYLIPKCDAFDLEQFAGKSVLLDDRDKSISWKVHDARLLGIPNVHILHSNHTESLSMTIPT